MYIYPDNLKAKATLWLWELRDVAALGIGLLLSVLALAQWSFVLPLILTVLYGFLSIRMAEASILDFCGIPSATFSCTSNFINGRSPNV